MQETKSLTHFFSLSTECLNYSLPLQDTLSLLVINPHHQLAEKSHFSIPLTLDGQVQCNHDNNDSESMRVINVEIKSNTWNLCFHIKLAKNIFKRSCRQIPGEVTFSLTEFFYCKVLTCLLLTLPPSLTYTHIYTIYIIYLSHNF